MKIFTLHEANKVLPEIRPQLELLSRRYRSASMMRADAQRAAAAAIAGGGGMSGGSHYLKSLPEISEISTEMARLGVQIKDPERGLIDFPCFRDGKIVLLCWQLGEPEEIEWWHDVEAGYAGRQRL
jgi:hypothetical protein